MAASKKSKAANPRKAEAPAPFRRLTLRQRIARLLTIGAPALLLFAMFIRARSRDETEATAPLFYAFPWPVIAVAWLVYAVVMRKQRRWVALGGLGCVIAAAAMFLEVKGVPPVARAEPSPRARVLFWNLPRAKEFPEALHKLIEEKKPDIVALLNFDRPSPEELAKFTARHPELTPWAPQSSPMFCAARGDIRVEKIMSVRQRARMNLLTVTLKDDATPWSVALADVGPWPLEPRAPFIDEIRENGLFLARSLVLGAFNTPFESVAFDVWRDQAWHALANAENSPRVETWPFGAPLFSLDHVWMSKDCLPVTAETGTVWPFAHQWIFCEVGLTAK